VLLHLFFTLPFILQFVTVSLFKQLLSSLPSKYFKIARLSQILLFQQVQKIAASLVFTARCYASAVLAVGLCLSVTSRSSAKTAKQRITQTTPHDSPGTRLSFVMPKISAKFDRGHPLRGRRMQVGWVRIGDF